MKPTLPLLLAPTLSILLAVPVSTWARKSEAHDAADDPAASERIVALVEAVALQNERAVALAREAESLANRPQAAYALTSLPDDERIADAVARWLESNGLTAADLATARHATARTGGEGLEGMSMEAVVQFFMREGDTLEAELMFQELRDAGRIDDFLAWIQDMAANDPKNPELQVALGVAYLQKLFDLGGASPEVGDLATQADLAFDRALELDPGNWDARFTKAVALSNWPAFLGRQPEAIAQFETLLAQQQLSPPDPQYAQTYLFLGNMYVQTGERAKAIETWRDGLARYPDDAALLEQLRLAGQ